MKYFMKKAVAIAMAGAMTLSALPMSFASEIANKTKLEILNDMGIIQGEGTGTEISPDDNLTRYRAFTMLLRLTSNEDEMEDFDFEDEDTFTDAADKSAWMQKLMSYLKNNDHGIEGYEDGKLLPLGEITTKEYAKTMLEALGYVQGVDFEWHTVATKAVTLGLMADVSDVNNVVVDLETVAELTYNTLATNAKGDTITLGEKLGKPVVETKLEVKEVSTDNLKQIVVVFNKTVDSESAEDADNYSLEADNASLTDANFDLQADGKTVVITLGTAAEQQDEVDLTVEGVESTDGKALNEVVFENVSFLDTSIPKAVTSTVVGNDTIKITFSEPIKDVDKGDFKVKANGSNLYVKSVTKTNNDTEVNVELYSTLEEGETTVEIGSGITDYANFGVLSNTLTATIVEDTEAPVVVDYKDATETSVTLVFDEEIELKDGDKANFYHTNTKNAVDSDITIANIDGNELTLEFTESKLPQGTAYVYILPESLNDLWDNENDTIMVKIEVEVDNEAPIVDEFEVITERNVEITFSENLDEDSAEEEDNYSLLDENGEEVDLIKTISYEDKVVTVTFSEDLNGDYALVLNNVEDLNGNEIDTIVNEFSVEDLTAPEYSDFEVTVYNAGKEDQMIKVNFDQKMATSGKYSVTDLSQYIVDGNILSDLETKAEVTVVDDGKAIEITIPSTEDSDDGVDIAAGTGNVTIARVADAAGNKTEGFYGELDLTAAGYVNIESVEATDTDTVVITFDDLLTEFDAENVVITTNNTDKDAALANELTVTKQSSTINEDGQTELTLTLSEDDVLSAVANGGTVFAFIIDNSSSNKYGEMVELNDNKVVADKIAPVSLNVDEDSDSYEAVVVDGSQFTLTFSESIKSINTAVAATDLVVTADGEKLVYAVHYIINTDLSAASDSVVFELVGDYADFADEVTVSTKDDVNYIKDINDNNISNFEVKFDMQ